jgi:hypothetical protein
MADKIVEEIEGHEETTDEVASEASPEDADAGAEQGDAETGGEA